MDCSSKQRRALSARRLGRSCTPTFVLGKESRVRRVSPDTNPLMVDIMPHLEGVDVYLDRMQGIQKGIKKKHHSAPQLHVDSAPHS